MLDRIALTMMCNISTREPSGLKNNRIGESHLILVANQVENANQNEQLFDIWSFLVWEWTKMLDSEEKKFHQFNSMCTSTVISRYFRSIELMRRNHF